jgi:triosephosphate isomerase (TIM)
MLFAYVPIWAFGTVMNATPQDAQATIALVRKVVAGASSQDAAESVRILYGGSVKSGNAAALLGQTDIDGALVGGASLEAPEFAAIVKAAPP